MSTNISRFLKIVSPDKRKIQGLLIKKIEKYVHPSGTYGQNPANGNIENSKMKNNVLVVCIYYREKNSPLQPFKAIILDIISFALKNN